MFGLTAAPSHATQAMSGAPCASTLNGGSRMRRPALGENCGGVADEMRRAEPPGVERLVDRRDPRPDQGAAIAADDLKIDLVMPRIDGGDHRLLGVLADDGRGIGRQRGHADHRNIGGKANAARGGKADAQAR